jgi:cobalamin biosynthesis Mg chelatase CobN
MDEDEVKQILENDEIEKLLIQSCSNKDPQPQKVKKIRIVRTKKNQKEKDNVEEKKEKEAPKKKSKPKPKKEEESFSSSSSSGSGSGSSDGASSSGSGSSSGSSDSDSYSSDSDSSNDNDKKKKIVNKKITIDPKTLEDFENKQDNHLIMIFENEIKDQVSNDEEIQILNSLNEAIQFQNPNPDSNTEDQSPIPFQIGDEINDEKFYTYVKECIKK